jgi:16S rRNA (uracil1498-N3)-methyltransferase
MRIHRFYVGKDTALKHDFWLHDQRLIHQWRNVLRMQAGQEVVLFDGVGEDRLYKIAELTDKEAHLQMVTELERKTPAKEIYLLWSLLKKDKNDWVLQKCTELGVSHFVPLIAERSEKTGFNLERAEKIVIEAAEQCGRSDIPSVREPITIATAIDELKDKADLYICEQGEESTTTSVSDQPKGIFIGPEGGWSEAEMQLFKNQNLKHLNLHDFTLRAETAAVAAVTKLVQ